MDIKQYNRKLIKWVKDHYWDSLEKEKDLILRHLRTFTGDDATTDGTAIDTNIKFCDAMITKEAYNLCESDELSILEQKAFIQGAIWMRKLISHAKI